MFALHTDHNIINFEIGELFSEQCVDVVAKSRYLCRSGDAVLLEMDDNKGDAFVS